jgi:hypothetical protein
MEPTVNPPQANPPSHWPTLPTQTWHDTLETVHLWTQVVGKIRLGYSPWQNHSWSVPLYVSTRGLRTSPIPYGLESFELEFDFIEHRLTASVTDGRSWSLPLTSGPVADFYQAVMDNMAELDMPVTINTMPNEIPEAVRFEDDTVGRTYDPDHAHTLWRALVAAERVMARFRADFKGKASPVHFFWGSFDLATTRFSGRTAPPHPGGIPNLADDVAQEAYSHEVTSVGFWPGNRDAPDPIFYAYAYPNPDGFDQARVEPTEAFWLEQLGEFALPYQAVAESDDPEATLMAFLESTHRAAADLADWDRGALECAHPDGPDWWHNRPHA